MHLYLSVEQGVVLYLGERDIRTNDEGAQYTIESLDGDINIGAHSFELCDPRGYEKPVVFENGDVINAYVFFDQDMNALCAQSTESGWQLSKISRSDLTSAYPEIMVVVDGSGDAQHAQGLYEELKNFLRSSEPFVASLNVPVCDVFGYSNGHYRSIEPNSCNERGYGFVKTTTHDTFLIMKFTQRAGVDVQHDALFKDRQKSRRWDIRLVAKYSARNVAGAVKSIKTGTRSNRAETTWKKYSPEGVVITGVRGTFAAKRNWLIDDSICHEEITSIIYMTGHSVANPELQYEERIIPAHAEFSTIMIEYDTGWMVEFVRDAAIWRRSKLIGIDYSKVHADIAALMKDNRTNSN